MIGVSIKVDQSDLAHIKRRLTDRRTKYGRAPDVTVTPLENFFDYIGPRIVEKARANAPDDTGRLKRFIRYDSAKGRVVSGAAHSVFVHEGTRPHWPPPSATAGWARRHGIPNYLVGKAISEKGTKAVPFLTDAFDETMRRDVAPSMRRLVSAVEGRWSR